MAKKLAPENRVTEKSVSETGARARKAATNPATAAAGEKTAPAAAKAPKRKKPGVKKTVVVPKSEPTPAVAEAAPIAPQALPDVSPPAPTPVEPTIVKASPVAPVALVTEVLQEQQARSEAVQKPASEPIGTAPKETANGLRPEVPAQLVSPLPFMLGVASTMMLNWLGFWRGVLLAALDSTTKK